MSTPTIGELRFREQLLNSLPEIADAIRENTKAVREFTGVLKSTAQETCKAGPPRPKREKHLMEPGQARDVQPPPEDQEDDHFLPPGFKVRM